MDHWIGGDGVDGGGEPFAVQNPANEETLREVRAATPAEVERAVAAAAGQAGAWRRLPTAERADLLHEAARLLREHAEALARCMTLEGGKPLLENRDEAGWCAACLDFYAELARVDEGRVIPPVEPTQVALVLKEPVGVVACIVPWNYPLLLLVWKLAPALAAGNAVVVKPSELTPLSTLQLVETCFAHLPPGTVNVLAGAGEVGRALVQHDGVDMVAFTGSTPTGQWIARAAADSLKRVNLEMGGKDAFIVCDDVEDLDVAARGGVWAACLNAGQVCTSAERFYVHARVYDEFRERFVHHAEAIRLGDPLDDATDMGPLVSAAQRGKVESHLQDARERGARVLSGGDRGGFERGFYLRPTVLEGIDESALVLREETFGPVAPLVRVGSLDEAIERANSSRFGLGANVYTRRLDHAMRCMRELRAGTVWINDPLTDNDAGPFGGFKQSGLGRELGLEGLDAFRETKHCHIDWEGGAKPWWYPYGADGESPPHGA